MIRATVLYVEVGAVTTGLWCDRCHLPHRFSAQILLLSEQGVTPAGPYDACDHCGDSLHE